jgi:leucyl aminopeptidase (aminopeptidase T)
LISNNRNGGMVNQTEELKAAIDIFIQDLIKISKDEKVLIYSDQPACDNICSSIRDSINQRGARVEILALNPEKGLQSMSQELTARIRQGTFNVICELSEHYLYQTPAWQEALKTGARLYSIGGLDTESFIRCIGQVNHEEMFQFGMELRKIFLKAHSIQILSNKGTDITIQMHNDLLSHLAHLVMKKQQPYVAYPSGFLSGGTRHTFMAGQLGFQGVLQSIEGTGVIDGFFWPPEELGRLEKPITLSFSKGFVIGVDCDPAVSKKLEKWFKDSNKETMHICIGFNPGATFLGKIMEAERVFGSVCVGIGRYPLHIDAVIKRATIKADTEIILENGSFRPEKLAYLQEKLVRIPFLLQDK